jgi:hypothetical protein
MKRTYAISFLFLVFVLNLSAQQPAKTKSFTVEKGASITLDGKNDVWSPLLLNHKLPKPDQGADEKYAKHIQDSLTHRFPRNYSPEISYRTAAIDTPFMLRNFAGNNYYGYVPNDNDLAISNNNIVCSVTNITIWSKNLVTSNIHNAYLHTITSSLGLQQEEFDPKIIYDPVANRFIAIMLNGFTDSTSNVLVGFSETDSTYGAWNFYALPGNPLNNTSWTDFPMAAITNQELFITVNLLYNDSTWQAGFRQTVVWQIKKSEGYNGASLNPVLHSGLNYGGRPVRNFCPVKGGSQVYGPDMYFISDRNFAASNDSFFIAHVTDTIGAPGLNVTVDAFAANRSYHMPVNALQPFTDSLQINDARIMGAFIENNQMQFVLNCLDTASGNDCAYHGIATQAGPGWNITGNLIVQSPMDLTYPNISYAGNNSSDNRAIIGLLVSSPTEFPGTGALIYDGISQYSPVAIVKHGQGYINIFPDSIMFKIERWGDYTGSQRKYNEPGVVWISGGYGVTGHQNRTWIGELAVSQDVSVHDISATTTDITLFPNPASDRISVAFSNPQNQLLSFDIYDASGKMVKQLYRGSVIKGDNEFTFSASALSPGLYVLNISAGNNFLITKKFIRH